MPAPQSELAERGVERLWSRAHKDEWIDPSDVEKRLARETEFDPDLWDRRSRGSPGALLARLATE